MRLPRGHIRHGDLPYHYEMVAGSGPSHWRRPWFNQQIDRDGARKGQNTDPTLAGDPALAIPVLGRSDRR